MSLLYFDTSIIQCFKSSVASSGKEKEVWRENIHLVQKGPTLCLLSFHCQALVTQQHLETIGATPWLVWLSGLSTCLQTKSSQVHFPVRAHAWVAGHVPSRGVQEATTLMFLSLSSSFPLSLKRNK